MQIFFVCAFYTWKCGRLIGRFQSRNRDAFRFKWDDFPHQSQQRTVSISESRCFSFQVSDFVDRHIISLFVSISESRCFSFQGHHILKGFPEHIDFSFNLGIEMLFVSSALSNVEQACFEACFNLGIEMLFVSRWIRESMIKSLYKQFQSRNRDAFRFKWRFAYRWGCHPLMFQSRNRDAFRFKCKQFRHKCIGGDHSLVSISESRCFSFQVPINALPKIRTTMFQSRNRDAFRFKR